MTRDAVVQMIIEALSEQLVETPAEELNEETRLFGKEGLLDSVGLVTLIVDVEQKVEDETGHSIVLADERAMSQKQSPFRTAGALADYILTLL
ncbi:acyl carrier protein [Heliobacterium undosum]|uniref:Acyl carrier protein n=1 Tax=Heliomicrobium undosum TaxID=121734 RepID=A0A845L487_9FIRM|nr:acyl carrier protein [Heliomicrobium undosum]MZP29440.1 acyl carrier protein [Heliomicrobium undosum]